MSQEDIPETPDTKKDEVPGQDPFMKVEETIRSVVVNDLDIIPTFLGISSIALTWSFFRRKQLAKVFPAYVFQMILFLSCILFGLVIASLGTKVNNLLSSRTSTETTGEFIQRVITTLLENMTDALLEPAKAAIASFLTFFTIAVKDIMTSVQSQRHLIDKLRKAMDVQMQTVYSRLGFTLHATRIAFMKTREIFNRARGILAGTIYTVTTMMAAFMSMFNLAKLVIRIIVGIATAMIIVLMWFFPPLFFFVATIASFIGISFCFEASQRMEVERHGVDIDVSANNVKVGDVFRKGSYPPSTVTGVYQFHHPSPTLTTKNAGYTTSWSHAVSHSLVDAADGKQTLALRKGWNPLRWGMARDFVSFNTTLGYIQGNNGVVFHDYEQRKEDKLSIHTLLAEGLVQKADDTWVPLRSIAIQDELASNGSVLGMKNIVYGTYTDYQGIHLFTTAGEFHYHAPSALLPRWVAHYETDKSQPWALQDIWEQISR